MSNRIHITLALVSGIALGGVGALMLPGLLGGHSGHQPYADEQGRQISTLSAADVEQLKAGKGWGLAKPAEFNGYPGPAHVIEFAEKLKLSAAQRRAVDASFAAMQAKAKELGEQLIGAEAALDAAFVSKTINSAALDSLLATAETVRSKLRAVHLSAHLEVTPLLSDEQKTLYASLRGYGSGHGSH